MFYVINTRCLPDTSAHPNSGLTIMPTVAIEWLEKDVRCGSAFTLSNWYSGFKVRVCALNDGLINNKKIRKLQIYRVDKIRDIQQPIGIKMVKEITVSKCFLHKLMSLVLHLNLDL